MILEFTSLGLCTLLAVAVSWTRSPFISLMYAVLLFINASVVMFTIGYEFMALVNLLVYVGALAVLFLFVIILLEIPATELRAFARGWSTLALVGFIAMLKLSLHPLLTTFNEWGVCSIPITSSSNSICYTSLPASESLNSLGECLYIHYADLLILNSIVLTIALFGALVLAHLRTAS